MAASSARINLQDLPWNDLLDKVRQGECVPFIGAGASYPVLPVAAELAKSLIEDDERETGKPCPLAECSDLAKVCEYLAVTHHDAGWPKQRIANRLRRTPGPDFSLPGDPHRVLANLNLPIYITTNYDDFMYRALLKAEVKDGPGSPPVQVRPRQEFARWTEALLKEEGSTFDEGYRPTKEEPVVFHLHGHTGFYPAMVASEDDYLDFLVTISKEIAQSNRSQNERTILPLPIRRAIRYNRLLFVGYGLADINFRVILRALVGSLEPGARRLNLSVQYSGVDRQELEDYLEEYFKWTLQLNVFWGSARDFATELEKRWNP